MQTLLFVHGWLSDHSIWRHVTPLLESDYRIETIDLPGHEEVFIQNHHSIYTPKEHAHVIVNKIHEIRGPVTLIGHSMGGSASILASEYASKEIGSILNICGPVALMAEWLFRIQTLVAPTLRRWETLSVPLISLVEREAVWKAITKKTVFSDIARMPGDFAEHEIVVAQRLIKRPVTLAEASAISKLDLRPHLKQVTVQTHSLYCEQDKAVSWEQALFIHANHPNHTLTLWEDSGHLPMLEWPERLAEWIREKTHAA